MGAPLPITTGRMQGLWGQSINSRQLLFNYTEDLMAKLYLTCHSHLKRTPHFSVSGPGDFVTIVEYRTFLRFMGTGGGCSDGSSLANTFERSGNAYGRSKLAVSLGVVACGGRGGGGTGGRDGNREGNWCVIALKVCVK